MPFVSRAQQRFAFVSGQPWARRWAEETPSFEDLPERARKMLERKRSQSSTYKADAPAPQRDQITGSAVNESGSAASAGSGRGIEITEAVETGLRNKMQAHNERNDADGKRATMGMLRAVWRRGAGAFSVSHRPGMTRQQWAMARVNAFLTLLARGKPENKRYVTDNDLLPEGHPKSTRRRSAVKVQIRFASLMKGPKPKGGGGGAEVMERIAGELCRARDGRFVSCSSREATPESKRELKKKERTIERQKEQAENIAKIGEQLGVDRELLGALVSFGDPDKPGSLTDDQTTELESMGLIDRADDGTARISSSGSAFLQATRAGNAARARDTLSVGRERAARVRAALEEEEKRANEAEEQKPKGGGGGRGGKEEKPDAADLKREREQKRIGRMLRLADSNENLTTGQRRELERLGYGRRVDGKFVLNQAGMRALASFSKKAEDSHVPPQSVRDAARRALEVRAEATPSNRGMTAVGLARARDLANGRPVSEVTLRRMKAYFDRHQIDKQGSTWAERGKGWQAWHGWGGDAGRSWVNRILSGIDGAMKIDDTDLLLLELEIEIAAVKHGRHNQATHGRSTGRRAAFSSAYSAARGGGASVSEARSKAREESIAFAQQERAQRQQKRIEGLQTRAQYARRASESGQGTEAQRRQSLQRAERLEARIRGEKPPARTTAVPKDGGAGGGTDGALPSKRDMSKRLQEISRLKDPAAQMEAIRQLQSEFGFGPGRTEAEETAAKVRGRRRGDESIAYGQNMNTPYRLTHRLVEMDDLSASNLSDGRVNPNYDQALQPRDRTRLASQYQVQKMAQGLNPGIIVHDTHRIGDGSPIIDANGNVLSGNGRTLAMQRAIADHPDRYAEYRKTVEAEAIRLGIDPAEVSKMRNPILVREVDSSVDRASFAREANQSNTLRMSTMEGAKSDRNLINQGLLADLKVREDQDIDSALKSDDNNVFVQDFLQKIPANERASITRADGTLNMDGLRQIKAAVYTATFDSAAGDRMAESLLESTSPDMKNVQNAIAGSLPGLARVRALVKSDARDSSLDITPEIADAVDLIARVRSNPTWTDKVPASKQLINYLENNRAAGNRSALPAPDVERLALQIDSLRNQPKQLREFFNNYSVAVSSQPDMRQADIGAQGLSGRITRQQLFNDVLKLPDIIRVEGEQESLFDL